MGISNIELDQRISKLEKKLIQNVDPTHGEYKGQMYFNEILGRFKYWDGKEWIDCKCDCTGCGEICPTAIAGDTVIVACTTDITSSTGLIQEIKVNYSGIFRVKWSGLTRGFYPPGNPYSIKTQIYRNGVAYGLEHNDLCSIYANQPFNNSEDLLFLKDDLIQLYINYNNSLNSAGHLGVYVQDLCAGGATITIGT